MDNDPTDNPFDEEEAVNSPSTDTGTISMEDESEERELNFAMSITLLGCCLILALIVYTQPKARSLVNQYFSHATPTFTITPTLTPTRTFTPTVTFTPTLSPIPSITSTPTLNMTARAYEATAIYTLNEWETIFLESFDDNSNEWYIGTDIDASKIITYEIKDGKYIWDAGSYRPFGVWGSLGKPSVTDFYVSVDVTQPGSMPEADYGITFREDIIGNHYYFGIDNNGIFSVWLFYEGTWGRLIQEAQSPAIQPGKTNKLSILAEGYHFIFFINDQYVAELFDGRLIQGAVGLAVGAKEPDVHVIFEFDNILLKTPK